METFVLKKTDQIDYLTLPTWEAINNSLVVGFSTRSSGYSNGVYSSFNLALHVGDNEQNVIANRKKLTETIGFEYDAWTCAEQVHGNNIEIITADKRGRGRYTLQDVIPNVDGIVTNLPDILLTSFYADCVPLYFFDPARKVIGLAHAGWKGTVLKIGEKMIETMIHNFGSKPEDIKVAIGSSIGRCCYEVNDQVITPLNASINFIPEEAIINKGNMHYDLDLKKINEQIIKKAGILTKNIEISSLCTSCNSDIFYSFRKEHGKTGRTASWIGLRKDE